MNPDRKDENPFRCCGEYYDKETDTIYLRARYYQPYLGRFLTRDTYTGEDEDPLSLHLYTYCGNEGVNRVDPSGHFFETILDIAFLAHDVYSMITEPSWENAANLLWDVVATVAPGVPGSYVGKAGKAISKVAKSSKAVQKGARYAKKAKTAVKTAISSAKNVGKRVVKKSASALKKRVKLNGTKLAAKTRKALDKAKNRVAKAKSKAKGRKIKNGGAKGERALQKKYGGEPQKYFKTSLGGRYIDQFAKGVAHESKVGYTSLTKTIKCQILKDAELIDAKKIKSAHWHFYKSSKTGKIGATEPLRKFLTEHNIKYTIEKKKR